MTNAFSVKEAIVFGWHKVKAHSQLAFAVVLTMFALQVASSLVEKGLDGTILGAVASVVLAVVGIVLGAGTTLIVLRLAKGEHTEYSHIVPPLGLVWKYFCASVLTGVIYFLPLMAGGLASLALLVSSGSITFIEGRPVPVPEHEWAFALSLVLMLVALGASIYLALRYSFARLAVLEHHEILKSLSISSKLTHGAKGRMALFVLAIIGLNILGLLALFVGLLVTIPITLLAFAHVYLKLKAHHGHN